MAEKKWETPTIQEFHKRLGWSAVKTLNDNVNREQNEERLHPPGHEHEKVENTE